MDTKPFLALMGAFLVWGGTIGGAFIVGRATGSEGGTPAASAFQQPAAGQGFTSSFSQDQLGQPGLDMKGVTPGQPGAGQGITSAAPGRGATGGGTVLLRPGQGTRGTIEGIEGNILTLNTPQGPVKVAVSDGTVIQKSVKGAIGELSAGMSVTVMGQRADDGTVQAEMVLVTPEGLAGPGSLQAPGGGQ